MKIKLEMARSGTDGSFIAGAIIDVPKDEALRMIEAKQATMVRGTKPERAVK